MKDLTFEKAMENLGQVVGKLEGGDLPLETLLKQYEDGIKLVRVCQAKLNKAKGKIETLIEKDDGAFRKEPFENA